MCLSVSGKLEPSIVLHEFQPVDLVGNVLWLDGSDVDGDGSLGGTFVDDNTWIDRSHENNGDARQENEESRPKVIENGLNNMTTVRFDNRAIDGSIFMDLDSNSFGMLRDVEGATLFSVMKTFSTRANQRVIMISTSESLKTRAGLSLLENPSYSPTSNLGGEGDFGVTGRVNDADRFQRIEGGKLTPGKFHQYTGVLNYVNGTISLRSDKELRTITHLLENPGRTSDTDSKNIRLG
ncbi:MAG: hypothetical protein ACW98K_09865, partial [Candidatus Kariarchaeaceae archaeon]